MVEGPVTHAIDGRPRGRGLGIPFDGRPGPLNAITDVAGVEVGHVTTRAPPGGTHSTATGK